MKNTFTVKEIMDGTGLTRQRVHALIKNRDIPAHTDKNKFFINWDDLLKMADNASMLKFLKIALEREKKWLDKAYENQKENEKAIQYAKAIEYARILIEGEPEFTTLENRERWSQWIEAGLFFDSLTTVRNPAEK